MPFAVLRTDHFTNYTTPGYGRLRVDVGQTGFFDGREFRTFKEWAVATTGTYNIKIVTTVNTILMELGGNLVSGEIRIAPVVNPTEGGATTETLPIIGANNMTTRPTPYYTPTTIITAGLAPTYTLTGGTEIDVTYGKTADNATFSSSVGGVGGSERGNPPATFYYQITLTNVIGVLKARWEERP